MKTMKKLVALVLCAMMALSGTAVLAEETYNIGICQLVQHPALDAATQGFKDALVEKLKVWVDEQYAGGRTTALSNEELEGKIAELSGGVLKPRH